MSARLLRRQALAIFRAALQAADPAAAVKRHLEKLDFSAVSTPQRDLELPPAHFCPMGYL
jgi:hypothetical protein